MKISFDDLINNMGTLKILELVNWDLKDVKPFLIRETGADASKESVKNRLCKIYKKFKLFVQNYVPNPNESTRIQELKSKLRGDI